MVCPDLYGVLDEPLEQRILPYVRERYGAPHVAVADVLLRAYRHEDGRQALAPHFDASSYCTVIVPLNPGEYGGGLFVQEQNRYPLRSIVIDIYSNVASNVGVPLL